MIQDIMDFLSQADPEVGASIQKEFDREQHNIELIASENIVSKAVLLAMGTCLTNKYAEGYPGKRYYGGCYAVDVTEELARQRACQLFDCAHANVQPHSGANANLAAFFALLRWRRSSARSMLRFSTLERSQVSRSIFRRSGASSSPYCCTTPEKSGCSTGTPYRLHSA